VKDQLFLFLYLGFAPAVLFGAAGLLAAFTMAGLRRVGRVLSALAASYFSLASLILVGLVVRGPRGDSAGGILVLLVAAVSALLAFGCWFLVVAPERRPRS
jgi:hypothetical protein